MPTRALHGPRRSLLDEQLTNWLAEYRALLVQSQDSERPEGGTRWDHLDKPHIEQLNAMRRGILSRWWGGKPNGPRGTPIQLTREEFFGLLRWTPGTVPNVPEAWLL